MVAGFGVALLSLVSALPAQIVVTPPADAFYDAFMASQAPPRAAAFSRLSPEMQAGVMNTHMRRYLEKNRRALTPQQRQVIEDSLATVSAAFYENPDAPPVRDRAIEIYERATMVFSKRQMTQVFTLDGERVPR